jgi:Holliday junction DNA helicase RuvA
MYEYLRGTVVSRGEGAVVLEAGGIGYRLVVSASTLRRVPPQGEARLFAHLVIRDDSHDLIGFADVEERALFRQLLQVTGVGPALALALLSAYEPAALAAHIASGQLALLTRVRGVGKRTGERILVELRDRLAKGAGAAAAPSPVAGPRAEAALALCALGLGRAEAEQRLAAVEGDDLSLEELVKRALKR